MLSISILKKNESLPTIFSILLTESLFISSSLLNSFYAFICYLLLHSAFTTFHTLSMGFIVQLYVGRNFAMKYRSSNSSITLFALCTVWLSMITIILFYTFLLSYTMKSRKVSVLLELANTFLCTIPLSLLNAPINVIDGPLLTGI